MANALSRIDRFFNAIYTTDIHLMSSILAEKREVGLVEQAVADILNAHVAEVITDYVEPRENLLSTKHRFVPQQKQYGEMPHIIDAFHLAVLAATDDPGLNEDQNRQICSYLLQQKAPFYDGLKYLYRVDASYYTCERTRSRLNKILEIFYDITGLSKKESLNAITRNKMEKKFEEKLTKYNSLALMLADMGWSNKLSMDIKSAKKFLDKDLCMRAEVEIAVIFEKLHLLEERERKQVAWVKAGKVREKDRQATALSMQNSHTALESIIDELTLCKESLKIFPESEIERLTLLKNLSLLWLQLKTSIESLGYRVRDLELTQNSTIEGAREEEAAAVDKKKPPSCCALQ